MDLLGELERTCEVCGQPAEVVGAVFTDEGVFCADHRIDFQDQFLPVVPAVAEAVGRLGVFAAGLNEVPVGWLPVVIPLVERWRKKPDVAVTGLPVDDGSVAIWAIPHSDDSDGRLSGLPALIAGTRGLCELCGRPNAFTHSLRSGAGDAFGPAWLCFHDARVASGQAGVDSTLTWDDDGSLSLSERRGVILFETRDSDWLVSFTDHAAIRRPGPDAPTLFGDGSLVLARKGAGPFTKGQSIVFKGPDLGTWQETTELIGGRRIS
jgi:hypothetical protein